MTSRHRLLLAVLALALTACSNDNDSADGSEADHTHGTSSSSSSSSSSADSSVVDSGSPSSTALTQPVIDVVHQPGEGPFEGALEDIEFNCTTDGATWTADGTVTNGTAAVADYRIFMAFLDGTGDTLALVEAQVDDVPADGSAEWSLQFESTAAELRCVPRVERRAG